MNSKIHAAAFALTLLLHASCASTPELSPAYLTEVCADCATLEGALPAMKGGLTFSDRGLLSKSREIFRDTVNGEAAGGKLEGSADTVRVYRWGRNEETPLSAYSWDVDAGERWHVVPESEAGRERVSCGRTGVQPIDEFYAASGVTVTRVSFSVNEGRPFFGSPANLD